MTAVPQLSDVMLLPDTTLAGRLVSAFVLIFNTGVTLAGCFYRVATEAIAEVQFHLLHLTISAEAAVYAGEIGGTAPLHGPENITPYRPDRSLVLQHRFLETDIDESHGLGFDYTLPNRR